MKRFRVRFVCALAIVFLLGVQQPSEAGIPSTNNLVYEVFVRSFADGDNDPNKIGDLKGVISKLDYLNDGNPKTSDDLEIGIL
ncbi:MAG: alpha-amylase, partial [Planctomycetota bacterium]